LCDTEAFGGIMMNTPKLLYNPFTDEQLAQMDRLVKAGKFPSRSSLLRYAVIKLLKEKQL